MVGIAVCSKSVKRYICMYCFDHGNGYLVERGDNYVSHTIPDICCDRFWYEGIITITFVNGTAMTFDGLKTDYEKHGNGWTHDMFFSNIYDYDGHRLRGIVCQQ